MVEEHNVGSRARVTMMLALACLFASCAAVTNGPPAGTGTPTASASPSPYVTSSPPASIAPGFTRFDGTVTDSATGKPLADACVVIATGGSCQPASPRTDSNGFWWIELPSGVEWDFTWSKDGYAPSTKHLRSDPGEQKLEVALTPAS